MAQMTINDFAMKYDIPYRIAYDASYYVRFNQLSPYDYRCYPEDELLKQVEILLVKRIKHHRKYMNEQADILRKLRERANGTTKQV